MMNNQKKYKIIVVAPRATHNYEITAELYGESYGRYKFKMEDGKFKYFPINITIIEEL